MKRWIWIPFFLLMLNLEMTFAQEALMETLGRWGSGPIQTLSLNDDHLIFSQGAELHVADMNEWGTISRQTSITLDAPVVDVELREDGVVLAAGANGVIYILNMMADQSLEMISTIDGQDYAFEALELTLSDQLLFVSAGFDGLFAFDLSVLETPLYLGNHMLANTIFEDVYVQGDTLFAAAKGQGVDVLTFDAGFVHLGTYNYLMDGPTPYPVTVEKAGEYLVVGDVFNGVHLLSFQPGSPYLNHEGSVAGNILSVTTDSTFIYTVDNGNGLNLIRLTDPSNLSSMHMFDMVGATEVAVKSGRLAVANRLDGLYGFRTTSDGSVIEGNVLAGGPTISHMVKDGDHLYLASPNTGLQVVNVDQPTAPSWVATLSIDSEGEQNALAVHGDTLIIDTYNFTTGFGGIRMVDISTPEVPTILGSWDFPNQYSGVSALMLASERAYVASYQNLYILDISDASNVVTLGTIALDGAVWGMELKDQRLLAACEYAGMITVDLSTESEPQVTSTFLPDGSDYYMSIDVESDMAYLANSWNDMSLVDVSDPDMPVLISRYTSDPDHFSGEFVSVSNNYAYVSSVGNAVDVVQISDPEFPTQAGQLNSGMWMAELVADGHLLYTTNGSGGVTIMANNAWDAPYDCHYRGSVSGVWSCPHIFVEGDVTIPAGDTLLITSDVELVYFTGPYTMHVEGVLIVDGPEVESLSLSSELIRFAGLGATNVNTWRGIQFVDQNERSVGRSFIRGARFDGASRVEASPANGGAIMALNSDNVELRQCVFYGNTANLGGGLYMEQSDMVVEDCLFSWNGRGSDPENLIAAGGGAIFVKDCDPQLHAIKMTANGAQSGGALVLDGASPVVSNLLAVNNQSAGFGGALVVRSAIGAPATPHFSNLTLADNGALAGGGAMQLLGSDTEVSIMNSILFGNAKPEIYISEGEANAQYSIIDSAASSSFYGLGCLEDDPIFMDTIGEVYRLASPQCGESVTSPAVDGGHPDSLDAVLACNEGLGSQRADMGYYGGRLSPLDPTTSVETSSTLLPKRLTLNQNFPNPFNPTTEIGFGLPSNSRVTLNVYDVRGRLILAALDAYLEAGVHQLQVDASSWSSGVYLYQLQTADQTLSKKMLILK